MENKGESDPFSRCSRDFKDFRYSSSEKTPFVMTPFPLPMKVRFPCERTRVNRFARIKMAHACESLRQFFAYFDFFGVWVFWKAGRLANPSLLEWGLQTIVDLQMSDMVKSVRPHVAFGCVCTEFTPCTEIHFPYYF